MRSRPQESSCFYDLELGRHETVNRLRTLQVSEINVLTKISLLLPPSWD